MGIEPMAYNKWVKSAGTKMSYYMNNNGGGKARFSNSEKRPSSHNSHFNMFSKKVDTLYSIETTALKQTIGIAGIEAAIKVLKNPSKATVEKFLKSWVRGVGIVAIAVSLYNFIYTYDQAVKSWLSIPGQSYRI